jgi:hypothetical protein
MHLRGRLRQLAESGENIGQPLNSIRWQILRAGALKDLTNVRPGQGYTGYSSSNYCNLVDLSCIVDPHNTHGAATCLEQGSGGERACARTHHFLVEIHYGLLAQSSR